jgi:hypothetical protein
MVGMTTPPPLPETFDVQLGLRMAAAHDAGDTAAVERARAYAVQEGPSSGDERAFFDQFTQALVQMLEVVSLRKRGLEGEADALTAQVAEQFAPQVLRQVQVGMLFAAGRSQGWLPERDYDILAAATASSDIEVAEQVRRIRRGEPR